MMRSWLYVQVHVEAADPERVALLMGLGEKATERPMPDIVHHTDPGAITFQGAYVLAETALDAYTEGGRIEFPARDGVMNDWVVPAMPPNPRIKYNTPLWGKDLE